MLVCPICECALTRNAARFHCPNGHSYDIAREGYVNLLRAPYLGDTRAMLRARRAFLDAGHYRPLADSLTNAALEHARRYAAASPAALLDVGCGEGTYIAGIANALRACDLAGPVFGLDVAKDAVSMAAKRYRQINFLVANGNTRLPFASASLDLLLCAFAPRNPAEFARVLAPDALFLVALPSPAHLHEARAAFGLLDVEPDKERHIQRQFESAFTLNSSARIEYECSLTGPDLANLILMSPSARHIQPDVVQRARGTERFSVTASFVVQRYLRRATADDPRIP